MKILKRKQHPEQLLCACKQPQAFGKKEEEKILLKLFLLLTLYTNIHHVFLIFTYLSYSIIQLLCGHNTNTSYHHQIFRKNRRHRPACRCLPDINSSSATETATPATTATAKTPTQVAVAATAMAAPATAVAAAAAAMTAVAATAATAPASAATTTAASKTITVWIRKNFVANMVENSEINTRSVISANNATAPKIFSSQIKAKDKIKDSFLEI
jgi:cytoskeletal protein RodZ